jgi:hypothetical protein
MRSQSVLSFALAALASTALAAPLEVRNEPYGIVDKHFVGRSPQEPTPAADSVTPVVSTTVAATAPSGKATKTKAPAKANAAAASGASAAPKKTNSAPAGAASVAPKKATTSAAAASVIPRAGGMYFL